MGRVTFGAVAVMAGLMLSGCATPGKDAPYRMQPGDWYETAGIYVTPAGEVRIFTERVERLPNSIHESFGDERVPHFRATRDRPDEETITRSVTDLHHGLDFSVIVQANYNTDSNLVSWNNYTQWDCPAALTLEDLDVRKTVCRYEWTFEVDANDTHLENRFERETVATWQESELLNLAIGNLTAQRFALRVNEEAGGFAWMASTSCGELVVRQDTPRVMDLPATVFEVTMLHCG